jgi:hypothetical protein
MDTAKKSSGLSFSSQKEAATFKLSNVVGIESLRILEGHISPRALGLVIEWAAQHKNELLNNWELAKNNQTPNKIEPLK